MANRILLAFECYVILFFHISCLFSMLILLITMAKLIIAIGSIENSNIKMFNLFSPFSYAPWCPACQQIELTWESFAKESEHLDVTVGKVDVTQEPGLSGRFFVTTLPTIYHANNGVFRRYRGSRTLEDLQGYVLERKWEAVEPVAGWKSPSSIMMHGMAGLFHFSGWIRVSNYVVVFSIPLFMLRIIICLEVKT
uniref:Thioredoxin domain-containing protein n=1 Tax=Otus sunia TaxID=257818 RepID=A0A8C8AW39_9STRI